MNTQKPMVSAEFDLLGQKKGIDEFLAATPEVRQLFGDGTKHANELLTLAGLQERLDYVKRIADAYELIFGGDGSLESSFRLKAPNEYSNLALDEVVDAYLAPENWQ